MGLTKWLNDIASSFQPAYEKIKSWKLPPQIDSLFEEIWKQLPKNIQNALWDFIKKVYDKYGSDAAIIMLNSLLTSLRNQIWIIK